MTAPTPERRVGEELTAAQKMTLAVALSRVERTEPLVFALVELMTDRGEKLEAEVSALHAEIDDCHRRMNQQTAEVERLRGIAHRAIDILDGMERRTMDIDPETGEFDDAVDVLRTALDRAALSLPTPAPEAGTCPECNGPVYHRDGKPGEFDHECSAPPAPEGTDGEP